jgi:hypothetical protein
MGVVPDAGSRGTAGSGVVVGWTRCGQLVEWADIHTYNTLILQLDCGGWADAK